MSDVKRWAVGIKQINRLEGMEKKRGARVDGLPLGFDNARGGKDHGKCTGCGGTGKKDGKECKACAGDGEA